MTHAKRKGNRRHIQLDFLEAQANRATAGTASQAATQNEISLVGKCINGNHPTLPGRVLVRWQNEDGNVDERWLPTLQHLPVRKDDRLLLMKPANWEETIVIGVIDGYARRPKMVRRNAAQLQLQMDEAIRITSRDGNDLLEIFPTASGPAIRVLQQDTAVEFPGKLKLSADSIELEADAGPIRITATDDVCINGEMIHLN